MTSLDCFTELVHRPDNDGVLSPFLQFRRRDRRSSGKAFFLLIHDSLLTQQRNPSKAADASEKCARPLLGGYPLPEPWASYSLSPSNFITSFALRPTNHTDDSDIQSQLSRGPRMNEIERIPPAKEETVDNQLDSDEDGMDGNPYTLFDACCRSAGKLMRVAVHNAMHYTGLVEAGFTSTDDGSGAYRLKSPIVPRVTYHLVILVQYGDECLVDGGIRRVGRKTLLLPCVDKVQMRQLVEPSRPVCPVTRLAGKLPWKYCFLTSYGAVQCVAFRYHSFVQDVLGRQKGRYFPLDSRITIRGVSDPLCGQLIGMVQLCSDIFELERKQRGYPRPTPVQPDVLLEALSVLGAAPLVVATMKGPWVVDWFDFLLLASCGDSDIMLRLVQMATQYNAFEMDDKHHCERLQWMVAPEASPIPSNHFETWMQRTLMSLFIRTSSAVDLTSPVDIRHAQEEDARDEACAASAMQQWASKQEISNARYFSAVCAEIHQLEESSATEGRLRPKIILRNVPPIVPLPKTGPLVLHGRDGNTKLFTRPERQLHPALRHHAPVSASLSNKAVTSFTAGRAIWCLVSLRQQLLAVFYSLRAQKSCENHHRDEPLRFNACVFSKRSKARPPNDSLPCYARYPVEAPPAATPSPSEVIAFYFSAAQQNALKHASQTQIPPLLSRALAAHLAMRWASWVRYTRKQRRVRDILLSRRTKRSALSQSVRIVDTIAIIQSRAAQLHCEQRFNDWGFFTRDRTVAAPLLARNTIQVLHRAFRLWRVFCVPQYRLLNATMLGGDGDCRALAQNRPLSARIASTSCQSMRDWVGMGRRSKLSVAPISLRHPTRRATVATQLLELALPNRKATVSLLIRHECVPNFRTMLRSELSCADANDEPTSLQRAINHLKYYVDSADESIYHRFLIPVPLRARRGSVRTGHLSSEDDHVKRLQTLAAERRTKTKKSSKRRVVSKGVANGANSNHTPVPTHQPTYQPTHSVTGYEMCIPGRRMIAIHSWKVNKARLRLVFFLKWMHWLSAVKQSRGMTVMFRSSLDRVLTTMEGASRRLWFSRWRQAVAERRLRLRNQTKI